MTDRVFDGVQTRLTHNLSFLHLPLSSHSISLRLSLYLYLLLACRGCHHSLLPPPFPPILSGLIVLHLFIQAFMAASSSCRPISPPDDGFLPQLSWLFIISVDPHHISLTLGRWFSHWTVLLTRHITHLLRSSRKHMRPKTQSGTSQKGDLTSLVSTADLLGSELLRAALICHSRILDTKSVLHF